jgi:hypothetical protein
MASVIAAPCIARAQAPRELRVIAPASCGGDAELRERVAQHVAGARVEEMPVLDVTLTVTEVDGTFRGEVVLREAGVETQRALSDVRCEVVFDAAALVIAFALVPGLALGEPEAVDAPEPEPPAPTEPTEPRESSALSGALRLSAHGSIGVLPGVVVGGELAGALLYDWARLELGVRGTPFAGARFAVAGSPGGDLGMAAALVRGCGMAAPIPVLELGGCVGLEAGAAFGQGVGLSAPTDAAAPWVAAEGALRITWVPWPFVAFLLEIQALVPIVRPVFTVAGLGVLHRPEPVSGALQLGIELRFR